MSKTGATFSESLSTLSSTFWTVERLKHWKWSDRSIEPVMQRFIDLNKDALDFLGITAHIETVDSQSVLRLNTSKMVGAVPIKSPMNGKVVGDLSVKGRYGEQSEELISLLQDKLEIHYRSDMELSGNNALTPPIYLDCGKYIDLYLQAERFHWQKFQNRVRIERQPSGSTLWVDYALRSARDPMQYSIYNNKVNLLTVHHHEWMQLTAVLFLAMEYLQSVRCPMSLRYAYADKITRLRVAIHDDEKTNADRIVRHSSDPLIIKQLKDKAEVILSNNSQESLAWSLDYARFFEQYVQYLFEGIAKQLGARQYNNAHYGISLPHRPDWSLSYLEPDLVLQSGDKQIIIDAKYKSHAFNWNDYSDELRDDFRADLHQVLAYSAFNNMAAKQVALIYPFTDCAIHRMTIHALQPTSADVYLVGIPMAKDKMEEIQQFLINQLFAEHQY